MRFTRPLVVSFCLLVSACASTYEPPESTQKARPSLDAAGAEGLLRKALAKSDEAQGFCASNVRNDRTAPQYVDLKKGIVLFKEYGSEEKLFEFDFTTVSQLRLVARGALSPMCVKSPTNKQVGMKDGQGMFINVDLAAADLDSFVAAVLHFSPQARLSKGIGL